MAKNQNENMTKLRKSWNKYWEAYSVLKKAEQELFPQLKAICTQMGQSISENDTVCGVEDDVPGEIRVVVNTGVGNYFYKFPDKYIDMSTKDRLANIRAVRQKKQDEASKINDELDRREYLRLKRKFEGKKCKKNR